jgi:hypothetical protein
MKTASHDSGRLLLYTLCSLVGDDGLTAHDSGGVLAAPSRVRQDLHRGPATKRILEATGHL